MTIPLSAIPPHANGLPGTAVLVVVPVPVPRRLPLSPTAALLLALADRAAFTLIPPLGGADPAAKGTLCLLSAAFFRNAGRAWPLGAESLRRQIREQLTRMGSEPRWAGIAALYREAGEVVGHE